MFEWITSPEALMALATLIVLEIVLGIDNIIFLSILVARLPEEQRQSARKLGLGLAMMTRLMLLASLSWVMGLVEPWFTVFGTEISGRDVILIGGGLFLLAKSTHEIHASLELPGEEEQKGGASSYLGILVQIAILDIVFSLDSVITAVGLVDHLAIMVIAVVASVGVMMFAAKPIGDFVDDNPSIKMLALSFLILVGFTLMAEGLDVHVPKGYIYFAMAFSVLVELINIHIRKRHAREMIRLNRNEP
ncbi:TerC family protein [Parathalassolituus penaei]|uniref:TerC family protein n=1 Tax=Parathalassolituus penaei TaxID=2997323 RepID=A0A9X3IQD1_9GAMM|nr:TerC family protein [Parathalassolituus penaei]MCY0963666.1 TerC family protein [Parathalassolituus penaei]